MSTLSTRNIKIFKEVFVQKIKEELKERLVNVFYCLCLHLSPLQEKRKDFAKQIFPARTLLWLARLKIWRKVKGFSRKIIHAITRLSALESKYSGYDYYIQKGHASQMLCVQLARYMHNFNKLAWELASHKWQSEYWVIPCFYAIKYWLPK